jgi:hypothetical protein
LDKILERTMSLKDEIAALRAEIDGRARRPPVDEKGSSSSSVPDQPQAGRPSDRYDVETLLSLMNDTVDEFAEELDKYPRLTALAALGAGLALGILIGRQVR